VITLHHITKTTTTQPLSNMSSYQTISYNLTALPHSYGTHDKLSRLRLLQHCICQRHHVMCCISCQL